MIQAFSWWLVVEILGLAALPLALRWLRWLPDRGYFFAKPLGILLASYLLWLGASLGIVDNGAAAAALLVIGVGLACWRYGWRETLDYWRARRRFILGSEALFTLAFAAWALVRAYDPAIAATEKPMEIAFLSSALRSTQFPPVDPWLAGYGISYYYFGYVMMATLATLAGVSAPVAFNLAIALLFAMTVAGAFALGYNLVARGRAQERPAAEKDAVGCGLLASFLVAISANLEGIFELLNAKGLLSAGFWQWLQIKDMPPPGNVAGWLPADNWWWFRAARVIMDVDPATKVSRDYTINEFPFFSFLLGDLHPHVLALPFAVLAVAAALNLLYSKEVWTPATLRQQPLQWLLIGLVFGGLGFLNSWDMPAYLLLLATAFGAHRYAATRRLDKTLLKEIATFGALALLASVVLYLPFYIGFRSQASGLGFVVVRTKLQHFAIFWGPLFFLLVSWTIAQWRVRGAEAGLKPTPAGGWREGQRASRPGAGSAVETHGRAPLRSGKGSAQVGEDRLWNPWTASVAAIIAIVAVAAALLGAEVAALLLVLLALGGTLLGRRLRQAEESDDAITFVWLLLLVGMFLVFVCEGVFVRDYFNNRMNTVFKLYYQAWLMLAVAGAYVLYYLAIRQDAKRGPGQIVWRAAAALVLAATIVYPLAATVAKTEGFAGTPTLDGQAFMARSQSNDYAAIRWLQSTVRGTPVVLEATGGSYSQAARVSAFTGLPTLLGWDFHEQQWRGSYEEQHRRKADVETIYASNDRATVENLLRKYGVSYVYIGPLERETYGKFGPAALEKFGTFMDVVYQNGSVKIYRVRG